MLLTLIMLQQQLTKLTRILEEGGNDCNVGARVESLHTAFIHLGENFVNWNAAKDEYMPGSDLKWDFKMFASFFAMALNWRLDNSFGCWQFNFQHYFFAH